MNFIGGDRHARAGPTADDALRAIATRDSLRDRAADARPVATSSRIERPEQHRLLSSLAQPLRERGRELAGKVASQGNAHDVEVRPAATVMLLRDASPGIEVFMLRRSSHSRFAPDAYVFPGGTLEPQDEAACERAVGIDEHRLRRLFRGERAPAPSVQAAIMVTGVRELFEECGVLFACDSTHEPVEGYRREDLASVRDRRLSFDDFLIATELYADARPLLLFSRWITPKSEPQRYDVFFFVAPAPQGQNAEADMVETHDGMWLSPQEAVRRNDAAELHVVFPTRKHLERLQAFESVAAVMDFARTKPIVTVTADSIAEAAFGLPAELENAW